MKLRLKQALNSPISCFVALWCIYLVSLFIMQTFGLEIGYRIWPMGEDKNWITYLLDSHFDGEKVVIPDIVNKEFFEGLQVVWNRQHQLNKISNF